MNIALIGTVNKRSSCRELVIVGHQYEAFIEEHPGAFDRKEFLVGSNEWLSLSAVSG